MRQLAQQLTALNAAISAATNNTDAAISAATNNTDAAISAATNNTDAATSTTTNNTVSHNWRSNMRHLTQQLA
jgi:hypothetical protein